MRTTLIKELVEHAEGMTKKSATVWALELTRFYLEKNYTVTLERYTYQRGIEVRVYFNRPTDYFIPTEAKTNCSMIYLTSYYQYSDYLKEASYVRTITFRFKYSR